MYRTPKAYRQHLDRVKNAKKAVDNGPPKLNTTLLTRINYLRGDADVYHRMIMHNKQHFISILKYFRTHGLTDTFQNIPEFQNHRLENNRRLVRKRSIENCRLGKRILNAAGYVSTHRLPTAKSQERLKRIDQFEYPTIILEKYDRDLKIPKDAHWTHLLLRPTIYFDISVEGTNRLGRLVIQLYTEACPQVVLEFVHFCVEQNPERLKFVHLYPQLWLEGELRLKEHENTIYRLNTPNIEYDMRAIDHGAVRNALSFACENLKGFNEGYINFSLTFRPLRVLNGKRVGFGHVVQGKKILTSLIEYGNKVGKARRELVLSGCGVV